MGSTSKYGRATINPNAPEALGICDRCGFLYNLRNLYFQWDWSGTGMTNRQVRVCRGAGTNMCYDRPQPQLRAIILGPDPLPARNPRPEPYEVDEKSEYQLRAMFNGGVSGMFALLSSTPSIVADFSALSAMTAALTRGITMIASMSDTSSMSALLVIPASHLLTESSNTITTEAGDQLVTET